MKKMFVVSLVLAAALVVGCSKKNPKTTPTGTATDTKTEMKKDGDAMGGATYGGKTEGAGAEDPCAAPH